MNILIIFGSPKRTGYTQKMVDAFLQNLQQPCQVSYARVFDMLPTPCNDCGYCKRSDGCSKKDLDNFIEQYKAADFILVATPIYLYSMPAPLKALFDRFQRFYSARFYRGLASPIEKPKEAVLFLTAGSLEKIGERIVTEQVKRAFSVMNTKISNTVFWENTDTDKTGTAVLEDIARLAKCISNSND